MEQAELRELEARCIQEEAPWCTAACPLHVDVRTFMAQAAAGDWAAARKTLERAMPLPGVLGRLCDHPCEAVDDIARAQLEATRARIARLRALEAELERMLAQCASGTVFHSGSSS